MVSNLHFQVNSRYLPVDEDPDPESSEGSLEAILQSPTSNSNLISVNQLLELVRWPFSVLFISFNERLRA